MDKRLIAAEAGDIPHGDEGPIRPKAMHAKPVSQPPTYESIRRKKAKQQQLLIEQHRLDSKAFGQQKHDRKHRHHQDHHQHQHQHHHHHGENQRVGRPRLDGDDETAKKYLSRKLERRSTPPTGRKTFREKIDVDRVPPDYHHHHQGGKSLAGKSETDYHRSASMSMKEDAAHVKAVLAKRGYVTMRSVSDETEPEPMCTPCRGVMALVILGVIILIVLLATGVIVSPRPSAAANETSSVALPFTDVVPQGRRVKQVKRSCDIMTCTSPSCACSNTRVPPYPMPIADVPQLIMLSFDNRITDLNYHYFERIFDGRFKNPNECPIRATFFISHHHTNYRLVQLLYRNYHEISTHGITYNVEDWAGEILGQREIIRNYAYVRSDQIKGFRAPDLKPGGDTMAEALQLNGVLYDSSLIETGHPPRYPYTFEYRKESFCHVQPCPYNRGYPGLWEIPVTQWQHYRTGQLFGSPYEYIPFNKDDALKYFRYNFERHYDISRAPFNINLHTAWIDENPYVLDALEEFMEEVLDLGDVYFVKHSQVIDWMKNPTPRQNATIFDLFDCPNVQLPGPEPCFVGEANNCIYDVHGERIALQTCAPCPPHYPFTRNTDGQRED